MGGGQMARWKESTIKAIFLHSKHQKAYQGSIGTQVLTSIMSRTGLGASMDPTGLLKLAL